MLQRIALIILLLSASLRAQSTQRTDHKYLAHLITISPGQLVYERFGHNAIFITDLTQKPVTTVSYDFGNFDFNERDFVGRFIFGDMRYWGEEKDAAEMLGGYLEDNRQVYRQELNLTDDQVLQLWQNLRHNTLPDNKFYHYDYYRDNCSTRVRDQIDRVFSGQLGNVLKQTPGAHSYRWHTRVGMDNDRLVLAGIEFAGAKDMDLQRTRWEECFLPEQLRLCLEQATFRDEVGNTQPMVRRSAAMNNAIDETTFVRLPDAPANLFRWFVPAGQLVMAMLFAVGMLARRGKLGRWIAAIAWAGWGLFAGLGGALLIFMWFFTRHISAYRNENLLQLSPLALALVVVGPMAAFGKSLRLARGIALILFSMSLLGLILKLLPAMRQDNLNVIAFAILANLGFLAGLMQRVRGIEPAAIEGAKE